MNIMIGGVVCRLVVGGGDSLLGKALLSNVHGASAFDISELYCTKYTRTHWYITK